MICFCKLNILQERLCNLIGYTVLRSLSVITPGLSALLAIYKLALEKEIIGSNRLPRKHNFNHHDKFWRVEQIFLKYY